MVLPLLTTWKLTPMVDTSGNALPLLLKTEGETLVLERKRFTAAFWNAGCANWFEKPPDENVTPASSVVLVGGIQRIYDGGWDPTDI